jgi:hypothetical protein
MLVFGTTAVWLVAVVGALFAGGLV